MHSSQAYHLPNVVSISVPQSLTVMQIFIKGISQLSFFFKGTINLNILWISLYDVDENWKLVMNYYLQSRNLHLFILLASSYGTTARQSNIPNILNKCYFTTKVAVTNYEKIGYEYVSNNDFALHDFAAKLFSLKKKNSSNCRIT